MSKLTRSDLYFMEKHGIRVFYSDRGRVADWRSAGDPAFFCGWYYQRGNVRHGAYMTPGAAVRAAVDAMKGQLPVPTEKELDKAEATNVKRLRNWSSYKGQSWYEARQSERKQLKKQVARVLHLKRRAGAR